MIEQDKEHNSQFIEGCNTDWNLNSEFIYWLNYWMKEYKEKAKIDLSFHKFEYKGREMTQLEIIDKVIELTELIKEDDIWFNDTTKEKVDEVFELFHLVFYSMWW